MPRYTLTPLALALALAAGACARSVEPGNGNLAGTWGSTQASLAVTDSAARLLISYGSCYGAYGTMPAAIPTPTFNLGGTYTQLTGVYPGKVDYAAQFSGTLYGTQMTLTVTVPSLQRTFGPYTLARGDTTSWSACLFP